MEPVGSTTSQELPSGSQPLWEVREKPSAVTQKGVAMAGCHLAVARVGGGQCWAHPCGAAPWKCSRALSCCLEVPWHAAGASPWQPGPWHGQHVHSCYEITS